MSANSAEYVAKEQAMTNAKRTQAEVCRKANLYPALLKSLTELQRIAEAYCGGGSGILKRDLEIATNNARGTLHLVVKSWLEVTRG